MKHYPSLAFRATLSMTLSVMFFALAIGVWSYQSDRLGISADVTVTNNRVSVNFDEVNTQYTYVIDAAKARDLYKSYGVRFRSANIAGYTIGTGQGGGEYQDSAVIVSAAQLAVNNVPANPDWTARLYPTSPQNALAGSNPAYWTNGYTPYPDTTRHIQIEFVDPNKPADLSTTDFVKFQLAADTDGLSMDPRNVYSGGGLWSAQNYPIKVTAKSKDGQILSTRTYSTGTSTVEFSQAGIASVEIGFAHTQTSQIFSATNAYPGIGFVIDDVQFNMPATTAQSSAALTANGTEFTQGETVNFTFTNTGQTNLTCPSPLVYTISRDGTQVFASPGARDTQTIAQGAQKTFDWDMKDSGGNIVIPGAYTARVECANGVAATADFSVVAETPPAQPEANVVVEKPTYTPGEEVKFTFKNTGTVDIECPNPAPYKIVDSQGATVFAPTSTAVVTTFAAGTEKTWSWDQKNTSGKQVPDGAYSVVVTCGTLTRTAGFTIAQAAPTTVDFILDPKEGFAPLSVNVAYTGTMTGDLTWDFGDGTVLAKAKATETHLYTQPGTYTVTLHVGTTGVGSKQVVVKKAPAINPPIKPGGQTTPTPTPTPTSSASPSVTPTKAADPGPKVTPVTTTTKTAVAPTTLVSTGGSLVFNLVIAAILSAITTFLFLRRQPQEE